MNNRTLYNHDCRSMYELPDNSVQCVVTSPPYWGLRKYAGNQDLIWDSQDGCKHEWSEYQRPAGGGHPSESAQVGATKADVQRIFDSKGAWCSLCGAWRGQLGLEPTPELYISHLIEILREIKRVLRPDGVVFLNLGDSYWGSQQGYGTKNPTPMQASNIGTLDIMLSKRKPLGKGKHGILKPKDLCLIPERFALAAQQQGWWVRSRICWNKPNPMPESVQDRPTDSWEHIWMLTKSAHYYYDSDAVREGGSGRNWATSGGNLMGSGIHKLHDRFEDIGDRTNRDDAFGRNLRSVWTFPTQPYSKAHFAVFPEKLPELCIKAATSEKGCCPKCGKPYVRIIEKHETLDHKPYEGKSFIENDQHPYKRISGNVRAWREAGGDHDNPFPPAKTIGWQPACKCNAGESIPCLVLDPFAGSGTTLKVAAELGRRAVGYEISEEYCQLIIERNKQGVIL